MSRFVVSPLPLVDLKLVERTCLRDSRGFLSRLFCVDELSVAGWVDPIAQINHTYTAKRGTVRGFHYQLEPHAEMKLVSCVRGEVCDVVIDLRSNSATYLQSHVQLLSAVNCCSLLIPQGFAHGFQSLTDDCELIYLHSAIYSSQYEAGLRYDDPIFSIDWPLSVSEISPRDQSHPLVTSDFKGF
ncbi:dTDP-4-dehydrorhamnose 3/5-epimerase family protein [Synechococcus sp. A15-127]|uniref:dTDP-4-dehydrorhamnose 3,5-epimerase family protein n=1 Tax=Synechococcus sp. A15-127 TaxID=1050624 RepID=UPI001646B65B|nr:dTDP-4-dehydrorhamnose 3,5-epimerase family protein [Synechococcus sp. A15-127]QNI95410.1 dTDP-4-dehydrorhamnose 3/5-epimerase family protein [Synechococcus sp. A15-127]